MGGGQTTTTQQQSKTELPAWVEQASQENYNFAKDVAGRPLQQYGGPQVADPSSMTTQGYGILSNIPNIPGATQKVSDVGSDYISSATDPYYKQAAELFGKSAGPLDIASYLNPYRSEVEDRAIANANRALTQQVTGIGDQARKAGAFGGSRQAIQQGVAQGEGVRGIGDLTAQLRQQGFDVASNLASQQATRQANAAGGYLQTGTAVGGSRQANQAAQIAAQQQQLAEQQQKQQLGIQSAQALLAGGQSEQAQRQAVINAAMKQFYEARDYPVEQLNLRLAALGMSPYGKTETGTKNVQQQSDPDFLTAGLGAFKIAAPYVMPALMASDRDLKTDIEKLGKWAGIDMYAYRYKSDPKSYPKVVGPMAQDIEKKHPAAVKKIGGKRVVDLNNLMEALT